MSKRAEERRKSREAGSSDMMKFYWVLGAVAVIGVGVVGYSVGSNTFGTAATEPVEVEGLDDPEQLVQLAQGVTKGDPDAPITIVEFGDFQCPGCGGFALSVKPQIELAWVQNGQAKFVFYDFPLTQIHPHAFLASRAARCAGDQDRYWEYHDVLFRNQSSWAGDQNPNSRFVGYAEDVGIDEDGFEACLKSDRHADVVSANMRLAYELGVDGTPTVLISQGRGMARRLPDSYFRTIEAVMQDLLESSEESEGS